MSLQVPFEARGVQDFPVFPIEEGIEYSVVDISDDGTRFAAQFADGSLGWFPTKYVRILDNRGQPQQPQAQRANQTNSYNSSVNTNNAFSREHDAAKRSAAEKEKRRMELQKKLKQNTGRNDSEDYDIDSASRQMDQMKTFTETRGYLSNAPGFNRDLTQYIDEDDDIQTNESVNIKTSAKATNIDSNTSTEKPLFRKLEERVDGPKYNPTETLPPQYHTGPWKCHSCQTDNGADRQKCNMCGTLRGELSINLDDPSNKPGAEWNCSSCKVMNSPSRTTCIMCGTRYKPVVAAGKSADPRKDQKKTPAGNVKKKAIVTKAGSGVELQYAKGVDNYKNGGFIPGHGAGY